MPYEIVTTQFVAHEHDLDAAYALYRERIATSGAEIVAVSQKPNPINDEFFLWDLRCQAAYDNLAAPEDMQLYEINALVDFATTNRDTAIEQFFFEDLVSPTRFPAMLGGLTDLTLRDPVEGPLSLITVVYLGSRELIAQSLFDATVNAHNCVAYHPRIAPLEVTEHAALVGPLWLRDATLNVIGTGDGYFSPGKDAWAGWFLTSDDPAQILPPERIEPDAVVLSRAVSEVF